MIFNEYPNIEGTLTFLRPVTSQELNSFTSSSMYNASFLWERPFSEASFRIQSIHSYAIFLQWCLLHFILTLNSMQQQKIKKYIFTLKFINPL